MSGQATVQLHGDLAFFVGTASAQVPVPAPRSVKDAVEALGVPHVEIGRVSVDGRPAGLEETLRGGERVGVHPPTRAQLRQVGSRFVCDVHLGVLARRLRLLGFDTWYRTHADDDELARVAAVQQRVLLSRDRGLLKRRAVVNGYCPRSDAPDEQLAEVVRRYGLAGRLAPLTRCARCNGPLTDIDKAVVVDQLPPATRREHDHFARCTECGQVYWPGTHVPRIVTLLADAVADAG